MREQHPIRRHEAVATDTFIGEELREEFEIAASKELHRILLQNLQEMDTPRVIYWSNYVDTYEQTLKTSGYTIPVSMMVELRLG